MLQFLILHCLSTSRVSRETDVATPLSVCHLWADQSDTSTAQVPRSYVIGQFIDHYNYMSHFLILECLSTSCIAAVAAISHPTRKCLSFVGRPT